MVSLCKGQDVVRVRSGLYASLSSSSRSLNLLSVWFCPLILRSWFGVLTFDSNCIFACCFCFFSPTSSKDRWIKKKKKKKLCTRAFMFAMKKITFWWRKLSMLYDPFKMFSPNKGQQEQPVNQFLSSLKWRLLQRGGGGSKFSYPQN